IGVGIVAGEVQRKTILPTLAKPVSRWKFCVGRYAGLVLLLMLNAAVILLVLGLVLRLAGYSLGRTTLEAVALLCVEFAVLASVAVLFASFSTPILAGSYAFAFFFIGHLLPDLRAFAEKSQSVVGRNVARGFYSRCRNWRNVSPSRDAASFFTPPASVSALSISSRSIRARYSSSANPSGSGPSGERACAPLPRRTGGRASTVTSSPLESATARSIRFSSSRTLPGNQYSERRRFASAERWGSGRPCSAAKRRRK